MAERLSLAQLLSGNPKYRCLDHDPRAYSSLAVIFPPVIKFKMFCGLVFWLVFWGCGVGGFFAPKVLWLCETGNSFILGPSFIYLWMPVWRGAMYGYFKEIAEYFFFSKYGVKD